jgi:2,3-bisphosphoglycerate-dependent phosphoglycerate mutase
MASARLFLVRHGETVWNLEGRMQGHLDSPLTERGIAQAHRLALRLVAARPVALYASDLGRTLATAAPIAQACGVRIDTDPALRERHLGVFQGLTQGEIEAQHPDVWRRYRSEGPDYVVPDGESARQRFERSREALARIAAAHTGESVVIVAHAGTLDSAFRACTGMPLEARRTFSLANASINAIDLEGGSWKLVTWGDVAYLEVTSGASSAV